MRTTARALAEQLAQANEQIAQMSEELGGLQIEQKLTHKLAAAGAIDLEAAVLVARARIDGKTEADIDGCVAQLRKEKAYLFGGSTQIAVPRKTAGGEGPRDAQPGGARTGGQDERPGRAAASTCMRYLKLRRSVM